MKLEIVRGGGIAGLVSRTRLDSERLPAGDAPALAERLRIAGLLDAPESRSPRRAGPDELLYAVTVADGEERTHRFAEEDMPDEVRSLIEWVDARPESEQELNRPR